MDLVMRCVAVFLKADTAMEHVIFPAATVLLDLTASELCIERVATLMHSLDLLPIVVDGASRVLQEGGGGSPRSGMMICLAVSWFMILLSRIVK